MGMGNSPEQNIRIKRNFSKIEKICDIPNLIDIQRQSYRKFLQKDINPEERRDTGLQANFKSAFPIRDFAKRFSLEFIKYYIGKEKYDIAACLLRGLTYAAPLKITVRLVVWDINSEMGIQTIRDVKEQEVYFGEIPLMTENGTFIINGTERVVVSQLHRSPGVYFDEDSGKYSARIIPLRGSWIDLEFDLKGFVYARIDKRRKLLVTVILKALGYSPEELLKYFYTIERIVSRKGKLQKLIDPDLLLGTKSTHDIIDPETDEVIVKKNRKITKGIIKRIEEAKIEMIPLEIEYVEGKVSAQDVISLGSGEIVVRCNEEITPEVLEKIKQEEVTEFPVLMEEKKAGISPLQMTLFNDKIDEAPSKLVDDYRKEHPEDATPNFVFNAQIEIYKKLRPTNPPTIDIVSSFFHNLFFSEDFYNLSEVGRWKINQKLSVNEQDAPMDLKVLRREDILATVKYLVDLKEGRGGREVDDIDHLGNRRVRTVGELLEEQYRIGLVRMERVVKERMSMQEVETLMPHDLINPKPVSSVVKEFFGSSQLSQFMDQTNPLSEITHKRRLSALGPGGLTRERAGFEVRDVHPTHYGRICPIETPEGPNIGLIVSLSTYGAINDFGFIETPYREVKNGKISYSIKYISALEDADHIIAQANTPVDEGGELTQKMVLVRQKGGEFSMVGPADVDLMDVSPSQLVSVATSLIPFLENDDANRALMGSNMQRQAVPLLFTDAPLVGTGMEGIVARDSGATILAKREGYVDRVDSERVLIRSDKTAGKDDTGVDIYSLIKFQKSNQSTCINQRPIVFEGEKVKKGQVIADGAATSLGDLALGRNIVVAFMPWGGYNFEDSILISERVVKDDSFTSIHIEEFEVTARDTKLGKEDITMDIPNIGEESLSNLDESGIIRLGTEVKPGDILVGKITPKGETQLTPEEKLLRAIFGEKAVDVKDTSLRVPPGVEGVVIRAEIFSRKGVDRDERAKTIEKSRLNRISNDREDVIRITKKSADEKISSILIGMISSSDFTGSYGNSVLLHENEKITREILHEIPLKRYGDIFLKDGQEAELKISKILNSLDQELQLVEELYEQQVELLNRGDELPPGVIRMVKVYIAIKRKLSVGDKMAGRHGNKGVVSRILPEEDMPYFQDGTPVDIVLNPLGVPSRMNVGQILETHLGWAAKGLGAKVRELVEKKYSFEVIRDTIKKIYSSPEIDQLIDAKDDDEIIKFAEAIQDGLYVETPVFDGATEEEIRDTLRSADLSPSGQTTLFDGRTGVAFDQDVTVGIIYMMKLHHLVGDKIHARSIGPYSLVTQQPLGGKAQFGGQRLGEMEVWAMEAYGASHALQEFLTVKSDDVTGRTRMYESIVKGKNYLEPGLPESFNVLVKELKGLALDIELFEVDRA